MCIESKVNLILEKLDICLLKSDCKTIEWIPVSAIANDKGLTPDAVRKQLQNGDFEVDVDFKYNGCRIQVHQGAVGRIQRKRRSSNG